MSDEPKANATDDERLDEESLRRLFAEAGPRPELPEAALAQIRQGLEGAWRELQEERSRSAGRSEGATRRRRWALAAVFVGLVVFAGATVFDQWLRDRSAIRDREFRPPRSRWVRSTRCSGRWGANPRLANGPPLSAGDPLAAGDVLTSEGTSRARLRLVFGSWRAARSRRRGFAWKGRIGWCWRKAPFISRAIPSAGTPWRSRRRAR